MKTRDVQGRWIEIKNRSCPDGAAPVFLDERAEAQERINAYLAAFGKASELDSTLVERSGYTPAELSALEEYYARQAGASAKPTLTASQVDKAIQAGNLTPNVLSAYEYYYGVPYSVSRGVSGGTGAGAGSRTNSVGGSGYDNGSLTSERVDNYTALEAGLDDLFASGASLEIINGALVEARREGLISQEEYSELRKEYARLKKEG